MKNNNLKIYELYPNGLKFSVYSFHYDGEYIKVRAKSLKQAMYIAQNGIRSYNENEVGITEVHSNKIK